MNMNLMPVAVIEALQGGRVVASKAFQLDDRHDSYALTLKPGNYAIRLKHAPHTQRLDRVMAGRRTHFDLPSLNRV